MKKFVRTVCVILVLVLVLAMPAYAEDTIDTRGSIFFASYGTDLYKVSTDTFEIWFDVDANAAIMDVLGVSEIVVYRSFDGQAPWTQTRTYYMDDYPEMTEANSYSYVNYVTYDTAITGYYYRARVTFYAKDSRGVGERDIYTEIIRM